MPTLEGFVGCVQEELGEREREREIVPTPYLLILGGMSSGPGGMASTRGGFYFSLAVRLNEDYQGALSGKPMFWQPYRCTTPGC